VLHPRMGEDEKQALLASAEVLRAYAAELHTD
jgi:hypothetical protein